MDLSQRLTSQNSLIPEKYHILSNSGLKVIAVVTMMIDHTASIFLRECKIVVAALFGHTLTLYALLRLIGRISFPLFAFLLVEGFVHTHDRKKYGVRLLAFALISELPWDLVHTGRLFWSRQNVFFTLFLGYLGLCCIHKIENKENTGRHILVLLALLGASAFSFADYRISGFGFILVLWLLRSHPVYRAVIGACFLPGLWKPGLAFIPIGLYNGRRGFIRGRALQFAFYAIYPAHMLLFFLIKSAMGGYTVS